MFVTLVNPPNHARDVADLAPPLGLLALAAPLLGANHDVAVVDLNLASCKGELPPDVDEFYAAATHAILATRPDLVGFTSMGLNSHVALELARHIKRSLPRTAIVLGGPHFSSIASETLAAFPWVDFIALGAAELSLAQLVDDLDNGRRAPPVLPSIHGSFAHPWSSYSLLSLDDYFSANRERIINIETGRGCRYRCTFCYSPNHWPQHSDLSVADSINDFAHASNLGFRRIFVVQDNFLNDADHAEVFCGELAVRGSRIPWSCYCTIRDLSPRTSELLANSTCTSVYIGIDTATDMQARLFAKPFSQDDTQTKSKLSTLIQHGVTPTCALICDPYRWAPEQLEASFQRALHLRSMGCEISLHVLSLYPSTRLYRLEECYRASNFRARIMFDCPRCVQENPLAQYRAGLFPFHTVPARSCRDPDMAALLVWAAQQLIAEYPFELREVVNECQQELLDLLEPVALALLPHAREQQDLVALKSLLCSEFEANMRHAFGFVPLLPEPVTGAR